MYNVLDSTRKEIRILDLEPGQHSSQIRCNIRHISLLSRPVTAYEAVSYVWGDSNASFEIHCNGSQIRVPRNTGIVLRGLRHKDKSRTVWIDAVCINQLDKIEREEQVAMMGDVYTLAFRTVIWLGGNNIDFEDTLDSIRGVLDHMRTETDDFHNLKDVVSNETGFLQADDSKNLRAYLDALIPLYSRPWFQRLWVVQEAALSSNCVCVCGSYDISWLDVARVAVWLKVKIPQSHGTARLDCPGIDNAVVIWQYSERDYGIYGPGKPQYFSLGNLLANSRHFAATNPRDKVYGLLGLTRWSAMGQQLPLEIIPDYGKGVVYVYCQATRLAIKEKETLDVLRYVQNSEGEPPQGADDFPSWVPRWNSRSTASHATPLAKLFSADQGQKLVLIDHGDPTSLSLHGISVDCVARVSHTIQEQNFQSDDGLCQLFYSLHELSSNHLRYPTRKLLIQAIGFTLIAGTLEKHLLDKSSTAVQGIITLLEHIDLWLTSPNRNIQQNIISEDIRSQYLNALSRACTSRRFFTTRKGYIGLGPSTLQTDDNICILFGGRTPYVLRPHGQSYTLIGECYIHDIMFGKALGDECFDESVVFDII